MRQVIRRGLKEIIVDEVPDPEAIPHHVVVRPAFSLISSGTETASIHQQSLVREVAGRPDQIKMVLRVAKDAGPIRTLSEVRAKFKEYAVLGYSGAGIIVDKHPTVETLDIGDRVAYGGEGTGHAELVLAGRNLVARVPESVLLEHACFTTLGSIALNAVRTAKVETGDVVAVIGMGLVGQLVSQLVRGQGGRVVAVDLQPERVELAHRLGAEIGAVGRGADAAIEKLTGGRGADCVIVAAAAKSSAPALHALDLVRERGRIVVVGAVELDFPWLQMYLKEVKVLMSRAYGPGSYDPSYERDGHDYPVSYVRWTENRNMQEFLRLLEGGRIDVGELVTHRYALHDAPAAYETVMNAETQSLAVILSYPEKQPSSELHVAATKVRLAPGSESAPDGDLRVGLIGAGNLARWAHLPAIKKISGAKLRAVCSASGARGKSYAVRFGADYCTSSYAELVQDPELDAIVIATRNQDHASQAIRALEAGKHVFVEKPMALTEEECAGIAAAVRDSGKQLTVGFNRRFAPIYREQKRAIARRTGPAILSCRVSSPGISGTYWMADPRIGGAILGEACHFIDLMFWMLGAEPTTVSAVSLPIGEGEPIGQNNIAACFGFDDGSVANLTYCTVGNLKASGERLEIMAPGLTTHSEDFKRLTVRGARTVKRSRLFAEKGYRAQLEHFFTRIQEGRAPDVTFVDGIRSTVGCLRILESARSGKPAPIDWDPTLR